MKVLLAIDGSDYTKRMLAWLAAHDEFLNRSNAEFTMLTVVPRFPRYATVMDQLDPGPMQQELSESVFAPVRLFSEQQGWEADFRFRAGDPAPCIADEAEQGGCELVVLGSHGHGALVNVVLGSVATGVLARCKTPVLVIR